MADIRQGEIMKEGTQRIVARDAQRINILAGRIVAETVRTTLGPKGMDKMLVDSLGDVVITNDGATILDEMDIAHPAAKMIVEVAKTVDNEVGDGTTSAAILAGELLKKAEELLDQKIHATVIAKGYRLAADKAEKILDEISIKANDEDFKKVAVTTLTGKGAEVGRDYLADMSVKAVKAVEQDGKVDLDDIKLEKKEGGSLEDSEIIEGITIDKEVVHAGMPKKVQDAKIALINAAIEVEKTETDAKINISSPDQLQMFLDQEEKILKDMADKIAASGATAVFCQKGIDDLAQHYLAKHGILAARRVKKSDMEKLAKATGGRVVTNVNELTEKDLGKAGLVEERKIAKDELIFVEKCVNPKAITVLLRGGTKHVVEDLERSMHDAVSVVAAVARDPRVMAGGGAAEMELEKRLSEYAGSVGGREQLAIKAFAEAMEIIPRSLAENAGLDPVDMIVKLRSQHGKKGGETFGLDVFKGDVANMYSQGVLEPRKVKEQAIKSASEAAVMILRIDDIIAASELKSSRGPPGGGESEDFD
ncbi:MAG: TCP-1/cpn60 chaperonin family protein [Theionarchaea archaeon]|nr:TCP-1/cpn60 chaperonin family protein [Theionarchaea archaeon]MBU7038168.1 TCP-1/cpn60 chaperonin family protein [Theionarchaea archaeon]